MAAPVLALAFETGGEVVVDVLPHEGVGRLLGVAEHPLGGRATTPAAGGRVDASLAEFGEALPVLGDLFRQEERRQIDRFVEDVATPPMAVRWSVQFRSFPSGPSANSCIDVPIGQVPNWMGANSSTSTEQGGTGIVQVMVIPRAPKGTAWAKAVRRSPRDGRSFAA